MTLLSARGKAYGAMVRATPIRWGQIPRDRTNRLPPEALAAPQSWLKEMATINRSTR
jgi:hypothetical protein